MDNFTYQNETKILFGSEQEGNVGQEIKPWGTKILLHYGGGSIKKSGLYDRVIKSLKEADCEVFELGGVKPNPRLSLAKEGIKICKENNVDFILAVGGGSVIDSAKTIAVGARYDGDVWDFFTGKANISDAIPVGTVLTIPAAGSEGSPDAVLSNDDGDLKRAISASCIRPKFSVLNPELAYTLPKYQVACGATDILAHLMERYFTNAKHVDFTDNLIEATMKTVIKHAPIVLDEPNNYDSWAEIMWAGSVAHNGLLNTGRIGDWASHMIEHEISGIYDVAHGAGLAVVFPAWMKYVYKHDIERFAKFAERVFNVDYDYFNPEKTALQGINQLEQFLVSIEMPIKLKELGIKDDRTTEMAEKCTDQDSFEAGEFVKLKSADIKKIYQLTM